MGIQIIVVCCWCKIMITDTRTVEEKMAEVNAILRMTAGKWGCKVSDLQWRKDKFGAIHVRRRQDAVSA